MRTLIFYTNTISYRLLSLILSSSLTHSLSFSFSLSLYLSLSLSLSLLSHLRIVNIIVLKSHREPSTLAFLLHIFPVRVLHLTPSLSFSLTCCFSLLALNRRIVHSRERTICRVTWGFRQSIYVLYSYILPEIYNQLSHPLSFSFSFPRPLVRSLLAKIIWRAVGVGRIISTIEGLFENPRYDLCISKNEIRHFRRVYFSSFFFPYPTVNSLRWYLSSQFLFLLAKTFPIIPSSNL